MRALFLSLFLLACPVAVAAEPVSVLVPAISAQEQAESMARSGRLAHCSSRGGYYEGIGFSKVGPNAAIKSCCFWGKRKAKEIGVARGPNGWYACVRYY